MITSILPPVTPQQQMALAFRGFDKPEGAITDRGVRVWAIKRNPATAQPVAFIEALARDSEIAMRILAIEAAQPVRS